VHRVIDKGLVQPVGPEPGAGAVEDKLEVIGDIVIVLFTAPPPCPVLSGPLA
jgi:hypothetical protein